MDIDWGKIDLGEDSVDQPTPTARPIPTGNQTAKKSSLLLLIGCGAILIGVMAILAVAAFIVMTFLRPHDNSPKPAPDIETVELSKIEEAIDEYWARRPSFESALFAEAERLCIEKKIKDLEQLKAWFAKNKSKVGDEAALPLRPFFDALNGIDFDETDLDERTMHEISEALKGL